MSGKTGNKNISLNVKIIHLLCYSKYFISTLYRRRSAACIHLQPVNNNAISCSISLLPIAGSFSFKGTMIAPGPDAVCKFVRFSNPVHLIVTSIMLIV